MIVAKVLATKQYRIIENDGETVEKSSVRLLVLYSRTINKSACEAQRYGKTTCAHFDAFSYPFFEGFFIENEKSMQV